MRFYAVTGFGFAPDRIVTSWVASIFTEDDGARADALAETLTNRLARLPRNVEGLAEAARGDPLDPRQAQVWAATPQIVGVFYVVQVATDDPTAACTGCSAAGDIRDACPLHGGDAGADARMRDHARKIANVNRVFGLGELVPVARLRANIEADVLRRRMDALELSRSTSRAVLIDRAVEPMICTCSGSPGDPDYNGPTAGCPSHAPPFIGTVPR